MEEAEDSERVPPEGVTRTPSDVWKESKGSILTSNRVSPCWQDAVDQFLESVDT